MVFGRKKHLTSYDIPKKIHDLYAKAHAANSSGEYEVGLQYSNKALKNYPNYIGALEVKSMALYRLGKYQEAVLVIEAVLEKEPNNIDELTKMGVVQKSLGDFQKALSFFDKSLSVDPNYSFAIAPKGIILSEMQRHEESYDLIKQALNSDYPNKDELYDKQGYNLVNLGKYEEALENLNNVSPEYSNIKWTLYNKSCVYSLLKKKHFAIAFLQEAIEKDSQFKSRARDDPDFEYIKHEPEFLEITK